MRIDSHQHFWKFDPVRDSWIDESMKVIQKDFLPDDLLPLLRVNFIEGTIAVQADQSEVETRFLLELASGNNFIKGVVGWLDLRSPLIENRLAYFSGFPKLKGLRHIVQAEPDDQFMLRDDFQRGMSQLNKYDLVYEILIKHFQLSAAIELTRNFPEQKFVLDHLAKPLIREGTMKPWENEIRELAVSPNVFCKISGMVTEADWRNWKETDLIPYLDVVFDAFGPDKLMYGSDWPVCLLAASYDQTLSVVKSYIKHLPENDQDKIMGNNAIRIYDLDN